MKTNLFFPALCALMMCMVACGTKNNPDNPNDSNGGSGGGSNNNNSEIVNTGSTKYIDLGIPGGLLWADRNVGADDPEHYGNYYTWMQASSLSFADGAYIPSQEDVENLIKNCTAVKEGNGFRISGTNGNSIFIPGAADMYNGKFDSKNEGKIAMCWLTTACDVNLQYILNIDAENEGTKKFFAMGVLPFEYGISLRLVKKK